MGVFRIVSEPERDDGLLERVELLEERVQQLKRWQQRQLEQPPVATMEHIRDLLTRLEDLEEQIQQLQLHRQLQPQQQPEAGARDD